MPRARGGIVWLTGLPGAGKTTCADGLWHKLVQLGVAAYVLDGDRVRERLNSDLDFSPSSRQENIRRVAEVACLFADAGLIAIVALVSPRVEDRTLARRIAAGITFIEVHVHAPLAVCEARDPKGLYRQARAGQLTGLTGIDAPYEAPRAADVVLDTNMITIEQAVSRLTDALVEHGLIPRAMV